MLEIIKKEAMPFAKKETELTTQQDKGQTGIQVAKK